MPCHCDDNSVLSHNLKRKIDNSENKRLPETFTSGKRRIKGARGVANTHAVCVSLRLLIGRDILKGKEFVCLGSRFNFSFHSVQDGSTNNPLNN